MSSSPRTRPRKVALLFSSAYANMRQKAAGAVRYSKIYGPWDFFLAPRGLNDPFLPDFNEWRFDGVMGQNMTPEIVERIVRAGVPTVVFEPTYEQRNPEHPFSKFPTVRIDSEAIGRLAARYFIKRKFTQFAYVGEYERIYWSDVRVQSFADELAQRGFSCEIFEGDNDDKAATRRDDDLTRWLLALPKPIALLACNDHQGRRVLNRCLRAEISVPYQISVLGVDDDEFFCMTSNPALSSVATNAELGGYLGAQLLDSLFRGLPIEEKDLLYGPTGIVSRRSTATANVDDPSVVKALEFIRANNGCQIRVSDVVAHTGAPQRSLEHRFQKYLGSSIIAQIQKVRNETILRLVRETDAPVREIAAQVGFESSIRLCALFRAEYGTTISEYRRSRRAAEPENADANAPNGEK